MSTSVVMEFPAQTGTIRSIAELHDRITKDQTLSASRRGDMASALMSLAKALGRPAETIAPSPTTLRPMLTNVTAAMVGHTSGRWRNIQSLTAMAMAHVGIVLVQGRIREKPSAAWGEILNLLKPGNARVESLKHHHLWRFARYCTLKGIEPDAVADAVIVGYNDDLEHRSMVSEPARAARDAARFWNAASAAHPGWPQKLLLIADNRSNYALPMESYPASLGRDIDAWIVWLTGDDPFIERDFKPLRPASIATRKRELSEYLAALVDQGATQVDMVNLASVVTPAQARRALRFFWDRAGKQRSLHAYHICNLILSIARHWAKLPKEDVEALRGISNQLRPVATGITPRNVERLRQLEDPDRLDALLTLPTRLREEAVRAGTPTVQFARQMQTAVAIELLLHVPLRIRNLCELRIGVELRCGPGKLMSLAIPGGQVKNDLPVNASLPVHLASLINLYLERHRPLLTTGTEDWLFPGTVAAESIALDTEAPAARITLERIKAYVGFLQQGCAPVTAASYLGVLYMTVRAMFPGSDFGFLLRLKARLKRLARPSRNKQQRIVPVQQLLQLGLDLTVTAGEVLDRHKDADMTPQRLVAAARDYRDGLMIALLALRPMRSKNLLQIEIGGHLRQSAELTTLSFLASETKDKRAYATVWPTLLRPALDRYIAEVRPILIDAKAPGDPAYPRRPLGAILWAGQGGTPFTPCGLRKALHRHTLPRFGHTLTTHLFRDCAATTMANEDPNNVRDAATLLGHHSLQTTEKNYINANSEVALDRHHDVLASLRHSARQRRRNSAENVV